MASRTAAAATGKGSKVRTSRASAQHAPAAALPARALLTKKTRDLLIPVTFRMPQSLKARLEEAARLHEVNQTDLINEAIDLNLQRYL